jgi:hypothetical protein
MTYIAPTDASAAALVARGMDTPVTMLNLMKFREIADYSRAPDLAPSEPISGREAYARYMAGIAPLLEASGGEVLFEGTGGAWFIGPEAERWDKVLLVRQASVASFLSFAQDLEAQRFGHHRTAALEDSRLLPLTT